MRHTQKLHSIAAELKQKFSAVEGIDDAVKLCLDEPYCLNDIRSAIETLCSNSCSLSSFKIDRLYELLAEIYSMRREDMGLFPAIREMKEAMESEKSDGVRYLQEIEQLLTKYDKATLRLMSRDWSQKELRCAINTFQGMLDESRKRSRTE